MAPSAYPPRQTQPPNRLPNMRNAHRLGHKRSAKLARSRPRHPSRTRRNRNARQRTNHMPQMQSTARRNHRRQHHQPQTTAQANHQTASANHVKNMVRTATRSIMTPKRDCIIMHSGWVPGATPSPPRPVAPRLHSDISPRQKNRHA